MIAQFMAQRIEVCGFLIAIGALFTGHSIVPLCVSAGKMLAHIASEKLMHAPIAGSMALKQRGANCGMIALQRL